MLSFRVRTVLELLKKWKQFRYTGLLRSRSSKLVQFDGKILTSFIWNLLQNLISLILNSESNRKCPKIAKTEIVRENAYMRLRRLRVNLCSYFAAYKLHLKKEKEIEFSIRIDLFISSLSHRGWGSLL